MKAFDDVVLYYADYFIAALVIGLTLGTVQFILKKVFKLKFNGVNYIGFIAAGFGFLGLTIGILTGGSRQPVVQVLIPVIPTIFGGLVTYVFYNKEYNNPMNQKAAIASLLFISFGLITGAEVSAHYRMKTEWADKESEEYYKEKFEQFKTDLKVYEWEKQKELGITPK